MVGILHKPVWLVVACAALVAQVVPQAWGGCRGRVCCVAERPTAGVNAEREGCCGSGCCGK